MHFQIPYHLYRSKHRYKLLALYHALRDSIVEGVLPAKTRLPSSRELAALYEISRGTVNGVYEMLRSEGYIESAVGRGTFVNFQTGELRNAERPDSSSYVLSAFGQRLEALSDGISISAGKPDAFNANRIVDFHRFAPDLDSFPRDKWHRCLYAAARELNERGIRLNTDVQGDQELREGIAQYLRRARGIAASPSQIILVNGSMQAIALAIQLLADPGDPVIVEDPGYTGVRRAIHAAGAVSVPVEVDGHGIVPGDWMSKLLFVTPGRQFPTGAVLSLERRQQLLKWAYDREAVIIEDDYDSEFRHEGKSLEPLKVLDREDRVLYIGSFSKTLLPGVRIGYAVVPAPLTACFCRAKALFEPQPTGLLEQRTLAAFMASGDYERHLRRMRRIYSRKFHCLRHWLNTVLGGWFNWVDSDAGLHIFGWWRGEGRKYTEFRDLCADSGIKWSEVILPAENGIRCGAYFNFPHLSEEEMEYAVKRMGELAGTLSIPGYQITQNNPATATYR